MKKFFLARRFSWPLTFSILLHALLIGGLVFASMNNQIEMPVGEEAAPMNVVMVDPAMFATPEKVADENSAATEAKSEPEPEPEVVEPEPVPEPEPIPEPEPEPIPEPKPIEVKKPEPKPEPKPVPKPKKQPKKEPKKEPRKEKVEKSDVDKPATTTAVSPNRAPVTTGPTSAVQGASPSTGSKILRQVQPTYPKQAFDRRIEGQVDIMFDIDENGRVENVRILAANPPRLFERDIRIALKKWRYTPVVVKDKKMTIIFKIDGGAQMR